MTENKTPQLLPAETLTERYYQHRSDKRRYHYYDREGMLRWSNKDCTVTYTYYLYDEDGQIMEMGDSYMSGGAVGEVITIRNHPVKDVIDFILARPAPYNILRRATTPQPQISCILEPTVPTAHPDQAADEQPAPSLSTDSVFRDTLLTTSETDNESINTLETQPVVTEETAPICEPQPARTVNPQLSNTVFINGQVEQLLSSILTEPDNTAPPTTWDQPINLPPHQLSAAFFRYSFAAFRLPALTPPKIPTPPATPASTGNTANTNHYSNTGQTLAYDLEPIIFHYHYKCFGLLATPAQNQTKPGNRNRPDNRQALGVVRAPGRVRAPCAAGPLRAPPYPSNPP